MTSLDASLNSQKPHSYARILGERPITGPVKAEHRVDAQALARAFGPPEIESKKRSTLFFWNFTRNEGTGVFTLYARVDNENPGNARRVKLAAKKSSLDFHVWVNDRIGAIDNGDAAPLFASTDPGAFAITRVR